MVELDGASLLYLFSGLPGEALAACAQVCRSWRRVADSEVLWQRKCAELEPHPHLRRDDLLPAFGGSCRAYYAWRWPLLCRPVGRILVESGTPEVATYPAPLLLGSAGGSSDHDGSGGKGSGSRREETSREQGGQQQEEVQQESEQDMDVDAVPPAGGSSQPHSSPVGSGSTIGGPFGSAGTPGSPDSASLGGGGVHQQGVVAVHNDVVHAMVQQATWSPAGALLAFTEMEIVHAELLLAETRVVVADGRTGQRLGSWALRLTAPPFYYMWCPCGTRLLFLSNWEGGVVALRALDIAPALLPPTQQAALPARQEVLLCTARPLFLSVSPTATRLLWHGGGRQFGLADAATHTDEDGAEDDCFFENAAVCGGQAPQWLVDSEGADWLLMPVMHPRPVDGEAGVLVLASLAGVSEALEVEGSRLSPSLLLSLSQQVAPFASARDLSFAASPDASCVAWCDRGTLYIWFKGSGAIHQVFPLPPEAPEQQQQQEGEGSSSSAAAGAGGGASRAAGAGGSAGSCWESGSVQAMQWSPDGRRMLMLVRRSGGGAPVIALAKRPHYRWMVYDVPPAPPPPVGPAGASHSWLGVLTQCCPFNPTIEFFDRYLPFFDQYSRSLRLWAPTSDAFCFTARGRPAVGEVSQQPHAHVQLVPRPSPADTHSTISSTQTVGSSSSSTGIPPPLGLMEAPLPVWLAEGGFASWSWQ